MRSGEAVAIDPRVLVVGYGNRLRGDDAAGCVVAEALADEFAGDGRVSVRACHQLLPEMAEELSRCELAVLIDASAELPAGVVDRTEVLPPAHVTASLMHHVSPEALVACARLLFKRCGRVVLVTIGGGAFGQEEGLTPAVRRAVPEAAALVRELVRSALAAAPAPPAAPASPAALASGGRHA